MKPLDDMLPEENEPQYKELITLIQHASPRFAPVPLERQQQILARVRERLVQTDPGNSLTEDMPVVASGRLGSPMSKTEARVGKQHQSWRRVRLFNAFAAVLVVAALLSTAWLIFGPWSPLQVIGNHPGSTPSITPNSSQTDTLGPVPNLRGLDYQTALARARGAGFNLAAQNNITTGVVIQQSPPSGDTALKGSTITVQMGQPTSPIMTTTPASLSFNGVVGQSNPPSQLITITNSGGGTLFWQASVTTALGGAWLSVAQAAGSVASKQTAPISVSVAVTSELISGTYTGMVTITATDGSGHAATGSPQSISVVLIVVRH